MLVLIALGIAGSWVSGTFSEGADPAFALGLKNCLIEKGYDSKEKIQDAKKNNMQGYSADLAACKTAVRAGAYGKGLENVTSYIPKTETSSDDEIDVESLFDSKQDATTTPTQTQYEMSVKDFLIWADKAKVKLSDKERLTIKIEDDSLYGEKVIKVTTDFGPRKTYVLNTDKSGFSF